MSKKELELKREAIRKKYKVPSCQAYQLRVRNAIYFSAHNDIKHELAKAEICHQLLQAKKEFITEAQNKKDNSIPDIVCLDDGNIYQIIYKHESDGQIAQYRKDGVTAVIVEPMTCEKCGNIYPKRNKSNICEICK